MGSREAAWAIGREGQGTGDAGRAEPQPSRALPEIVLLLFAPQLDPVIYVGPFVIFDIFVAVATGLTPLSPVGVLGTALTMNLRPAWKPGPPKRFAWILGGSLGIVCLTMRLLNTPPILIVAVLAICFVLTWLEVALGFCVGCWMHSKLLECEECEVRYTPE